MTNETQVEVTQVLKPCPFCGGEAEIVKVWHPATYAMRCLSCQAEGPNVKAGCAEDARPEAITAWSTRIEAEKRNNDREVVEALHRLLDAADRFNGVHYCQNRIAAPFQGQMILAVQNAYRVLGIGRTSSPAIPTALEGDE